MERYENKCPKHDKDFQGERYCPDCDYRWQPQNYVAYPNTLWWDTWCSGEDGIGRQFYFTEDPIKDIPEKLIGKENTVPAFGFAFYRPKQQRTIPLKYSLLFESDYSPSPEFSYHLYNTSGIYFVNCTSHMKSAYLTSASMSGEVKTLGFMTNNSGGLQVNSTKRSGIVTKKKKQVSIGAGAKIKQGLQIDPYALDTWKDTPDAVMTIYFVFQEKFKEMKAKGFRDFEGKKEGMLAGLPIG